MENIFSAEFIKGTLKILDDVFEEYTVCFKTKTKNVVDKAKKYVEGKFLTEGKGNMVKYSKIVLNTNDQELQHCISNSPWCPEVVTTKVQKDVTKLIGNKKKGSLHVDGSGIVKQGKNSAGVARQWCGRIGKVENCQEGVFAGYVYGNRRILINNRLFIPEEWFDDCERLKKCGVPEHIKFKKKTTLGIEMIKEAIENGVLFGWVGADTFYGRDPEFRKGIEELGKTYFVDVPCDMRAWMEKPQVLVPKRNGFRGRFPIKEKVIGDKTKPQEVREIANNIPAPGWHRCFVRDTVRGRLEIDIAALRVYVSEGNLPGQEQWLVIRKDKDKNGKVIDTKYSLSNASQSISIEELAEMACSRFWIERALEDAKGICGMADYRVRSWKGWHHHMALTFLAMLILLMMLIRMSGRADGITLQNIVNSLLKHLLPAKKYGVKEAINLFERGIKKYMSTWRSYHKNMS